MEILRWAPCALRFRITDACFTAAFFLMAGKRLAVRQNLKCILEREPKKAEVRRVFTEYGRYWAESVDIKNIWIRRRKVYNGPLFPISVDRLIGLTFHLGNFELFGPEYFNHYRTMFPVVAERLRPGFLTSYFRARRRRHHLDSIPHDDPRTILGTLRNGHSLGIVCDRMIGRGHGIRGTLFGRPVRLPLALLSYAKNENIPVFVAYAISGSGCIEFQSYRIETSDLDSAAARVISILEDAVRRYPFQWHLLSRFWEEVEESEES